MAPPATPPEHLGRDLGPGELAGCRHCHSNRGIDVRAAEPLGTKHADEDAHRPARSDHNPARVVTLGLGQHHIRNDAVPEDDEKRSPDKLLHDSIHVSLITLLID